MTRVDLSAREADLILEALSSLLDWEDLDEADAKAVISIRRKLGRPAETERGTDTCPVK
jgi:hypothetical protein